MILRLKSCFMLLSVFLSSLLLLFSTCQAFSGPPYTYTEYFRYDDDATSAGYAPWDIAFGVGGYFGNDLYILDTRLWRVSDVNHDGDCLDAGEGTVLFRAPGDFTRATGLAFGRNVSNDFDNDLFVFDDGPNKIYRITDNNGLPLTLGDFTTGTLFTPWKGVFSNDGNHLFLVDAWVYGPAQDGRIFSVDPTSTISTFVSGGVNADLYDCTRIKITSDGWVTSPQGKPGDTATHLIQFRDNSIPPDGDANDPGESRILLNKSEGLAVHAFAFDNTDRFFIGTKYVDSDDRIILELVDGNGDGDFQDPGERITIVTMPEFADGGGIYSMTFDANGDLFVGTAIVNPDSSRTGIIYKVTSNGMPPTATTGEASSIGPTAATLNGTVNANDSSTSVTFEYGLTNAYGTSVTADQSPLTGVTDTPVSKTIFGLSPLTTYHYRVTATSSEGTTLGNDEMFTTSSNAISTTEREALIALYNSTDGDNWTHNEGWKTPPLAEDGFGQIGTEGDWYGITVENDQVTEIDFYYNQLTGSIPPELENLTNLEYLLLSDNQLTGNIPESLVNLVNLRDGSGLVLNSNHLYTNHPNVKAFVDLKNGTGWEETQTDVLPELSTANITSITTHSAVGGGEVTSEGAEPVTARGVCWSTSADPTIADSHTTDGSGLGSFTSNLTSLSNHTTYYVRAWGANLVGTAYGNEITFTTGVHPELTTQEASDLGMWSATGYGTVTNVGTPAPTQHGLCWNTYGMPDILWDDYTEEGPVTATGTFTSELTELSPGTLYYVRAYATNTNGTFYGNEASFSTLSSTTPGACFSDSGQRLGAIWPDYPEDFSYSHGVALGDLNGNSHPDAFVVNAHCNPNTVWFNDGSGAFTDSGQRLGLIPDPAYPEDYAPSRRVALGNLDGDENENLDAFVANGGNQADTVWFNDGSGAFTDSGQRLGLGIDPSYPSGYTVSQGLALGDLDDDDDLDAFVANAEETPNTVWFNDGAGNFSDSGQRLGATCSKAVALGKLNDDDHLDAFVGNDAGFINAVYLNDGSGKFTKLEQPYFTDDATAQDVALGDLDGDGDLDVYIARGLGESDQIWLNDGTGIFTNSGQQSLGDTCSQGVALGDVDKDGDLDAFVVKAAGEANQLFLNDGNGQFSPAATMGQFSSHGVGLSDLNSDGTLDAFVANADGEPNKVWFNRAGAGISGTVYAADGTTPLQGVAITVNLYSGDPCDQPQLLGSTTTNPADGAYSMGCLLPGDYYLQAGGNGYQTEWWATPLGAVDCQNAKSIVLNATEQKNGINFQLSLIPPQIFYADILNGNDGNDGSSNHPWKTLHYAISRINALFQGGTYILHIALGTYNIAAGESDTELKITQNNVTLMGESGSGPVLSGTGAQNWSKGVIINAANVTLENLYFAGFSEEGQTGIEILGTASTIKKCHVHDNYNGIYIGPTGDSNTISGCEIFTNAHEGVWISGGTGNTVLQNSIHDHSNPYSAGIKVEACSPQIQRNLIFDNWCGIFIFAQGYEERGSIGTNPLIVNNVIYEQTDGKVNYGILINTGDYGSANPEIYHNTLDRGTYDGILIEIYGTSTANPAIRYNIITNFSQYGIENSGGNPWIDYNDVWNNASGNYKGCEYFLGDKNISENPLYDGTYNLQSTSPCINAIPIGDPPNDPVTVDLNGNSRPYGSGFDIGCYENDNLPAVTTTAASSITTTSASSGGNVTSAGGESSVSARGVCWSTSANPTISNSHTSDGTGTGTFTSSITGLSPNTLYHVRAYATNSDNVTGYGTDLTFTTSVATAPILTTTPVSSITTNSASSGGNVTSDGGASITARGVCWSTSANPTISNSHTSDGTGTGTFTSSITGLNSGTTYYVRAYATNSAGSGYGNQTTFTTLSLPSITTFTPTSGGKDASVTITGTNFTAATEVKFGGTAASNFTVDSNTQITAIVGVGSTGKVAVVTPSGAAESAVDFTYTAVMPGTYYVNITIGNDSNNGSDGHPFKTLHHAVNQINSGNPGIYTLIAALGTYSVPNGEADSQMILSQSMVTIIGQSGSAPIIDGANAQNWTRGLEVTGSSVTVKNLHVTGFSDADEEGIRISFGTGNEIQNCSISGNNWGIRVWFASGSIIEDCEIFDNITHGIDIVKSTETAVLHNSIHDNPQYGIRVESSPKISRNLIFDNKYGIFIFAQDDVGRSNAISSPLIVNNVIYEHTTGKVDYGILINTDSYGTSNPEIYHNTLDRGTYEGILIEKYGEISPGPIIKYNIITNFSQYGIENSGGSPVIDYNDVWNNASGNYKDCEGFIGSKNISDNPLYGSYTLQSNSPCINKIPASSGDPVDIDYPGFKRPRPTETAKDMGAYEYVGSITDPYTLPGGTGQITDYRIFTVPFYMTGAQMLAAMENVLGPYNNTGWRGFASLGGNYLEFSDGSFQTLPIIPGMGFWMVSLRTDTIPFEGRTAPDGVDYEKLLSPGWHMMGLPWVSENINLGSIKVTDGINTYAVTSSENTLTQRCIWDYTGTGSYNGYEKRDLSTDNLQCGTGYFFKVISTKNVTIIIPPKSDASSFRRGERGSTGNEEEPPPPPGGRACPEFHNGRLVNVTFPRGGQECTYSGGKSYTLGNGVRIPEGARVVIKP